MALEGLSEDQIVEYERQLVSGIPPERPIGNKSLRTQLITSGNGWTEDLFWGIRNRLIEQGRLETGRGKGGSIRLVPTREPEPANAGETFQAAATQSMQPTPPAQEVTTAARVGEAPSQAALPPISSTERDLYGPMAEVIKTKWARDQRLDLLLVEVTAQQGARQTGGRWTRPDITVASYRSFPYIPGKIFDVITFEVKPYPSIDITVVYEALGHRRAATKSYALLYIPEDKIDEMQSTVDEICTEAKRLGVGVIVASVADDYDTWDEQVEAVRHEPDPEKLNEFIAQQVSQGFREQIVRWR